MENIDLVPTVHARALYPPLHGCFSMMRFGGILLLICTAYTGRADPGAEDGWLRRLTTEAEAVTRAVPRLTVLQAPPVVALSTPSPAPASALVALQLKPIGRITSSMAAFGLTRLEPPTPLPRADGGWKGALLPVDLSCSIPARALACTVSLPLPPPRVQIQQPTVPVASAVSAWTLAGSGPAERASAPPRTLPVWPASSDSRLSCCDAIAPTPMPLLSPRSLMRALA
jgi:hypothetical protein